MTKGYTEIDSKFYQESDVVMLPTKKAHGALIKDNGKHTNYCMKTYNPKGYLTQKYLKSIDCSSFHLYFLSDEEIKESEMTKGEHYYSTNTNKIHIWGTGNCYAITGKRKIIATTDSELKVYCNHCKGTGKIHNGMFDVDCDKCYYKNTNMSLPRPSNSFIEKFITEYNKGNIIKKVLIEYEAMNTTIVNRTYNDFEPKIQPDNTITIKPLVVKESWNETELTNIVFKFKDTIALELGIDADSGVFDYKKVMKFIKQNL